MQPREEREVRARLERFLEDVLWPVGRRDRRNWGKVYVRGLVQDGGRRTAAEMARRLPDGDEQALQQFVGQSPWAHEPVRKELALKMVGMLSPRVAWVVDDTGFPKKGKYSVGVARQYSGTLGKIGNCQVGVSLNYATDDACVPLDFSLYLPKEWTEDRERCGKAGVPEDVTFKTKWQLALEMIDRALSWGVPPGVVVADSGYGKVAEFRKGLQDRELSYVVGVDQDTGVWVEEVRVALPAYQGRGRPRTRIRTLPRPQSVLEVAKELPQEAWQTVTWREGTKGPMTGRFACLRVQPSHGWAEGKVEHPVVWLLVEWPPEAEKPTKFWLSNLDADTTLPELVRLAKIRWWVEQNYQQMKEELGLDHYEGRSWRGWHHHVTLTMIAFCFLVAETLLHKKNFWVWEGLPIVDDTPSA